VTLGKNAGRRYGCGTLGFANVRPSSRRLRLLPRLVVSLAILGLLAGAALSFAATTATAAAIYNYDHPAELAQPGTSSSVLQTGSSASGTVRLQEQHGRPRSGARAGVAAKEGLSWAEQSGILRTAARGKGNFGLGSASADDANALGRAWVGDGYRVASDGKTLVSESGLRVYRPPSFKPKLGKNQANFEYRVEGQRTGRTLGNGHLDITGLP
jgi:hypothetical protein